MKHQCPKCYGAGHFRDPLYVFLQKCELCDGRGRLSEVEHQNYLAEEAEKLKPRKKTLADRLTEFCEESNLTFGKLLGLFSLGFIGLMVIVGLITGDSSPNTKEPRLSSEEQMERALMEKIANGEELTWLEKKVVKEWQEEGRKRSRE